MPRLENWSCGIRNPYAPPEVQQMRLSGVVYDHPRLTDGKKVTTTPVVSSEGRMAQTRSGSIYVLGEEDKEWLSWLKEAGISYNPESPITVHGSNK